MGGGRRVISGVEGHAFGLERGVFFDGVACSSEGVARAGGGGGLAVGLLLHDASQDHLINIIL